MNRITASQKMKYGLAKTFKEELIEDLQKNRFSMNIDEAMSDSNKKVLTIMVSYFKPSLCKVS